MIEEFSVDEKGIESLNSDFVDGLDLGVRDVRRLSEIEWDKTSQAWMVRCITHEQRIELKDQTVVSIRLASPVLYTGSTYRECVDWEHNNQQELKAWINSHS